MSPSHNVPAIDTHAHIAPDVTSGQVRALGNAVVFAMTRTLDEARAVVRRQDTALVWGLGTHPGVPAALAEYDPVVFEKALAHFAVVGEVGLDRRGSLGPQQEVFNSILDLCREQPVIISVHSTGRVRAVLDSLGAAPHPGAVLHWFTGTPAELAEAAALGCYFSVNAAMDPTLIAAIPPDRLLTETDFPSSRRKTQASKPGDIAAVARLISETHGITNVGEHVLENLADLLKRSGARDRLATQTRQLFGT